MNRRSRWYLAVLSLALIACALPVLASGLGIAMRPVAWQLTAVLPLALLLALYTRLDRAPRLRLPLEAALFGIVLSSAFNFPMFLLASQPGAFADAALRRADSALGLDVPAWVHWISLHPRVEQAQALAYDSLHVLTVGALLIPALAGRERWVSELLIALAGCVVLSLLIFARVRAIGPWEGGAFIASLEQQRCSTLLQALRGHAHVVIDIRGSAPLIAFPSWHVILALLSAHTLARFEYLRWPAITWAFAIALSTLTSGWHYGVDVLGGAAVAALSIVASRRLHATWARSSLTQRHSTASVETTFAAAEK